jgi:DNA-directed RNA polymerase specialized sigma24 family protein
MEERLDTNGQLWTANASQHRGRSGGKTTEGTVCTSVPHAAQRTWCRAIEYATRHLGDQSRATEVVEDVAQSTAKAHQGKPIANPDSYFFSGVVRRVKRLLEREQRIEYVGSVVDLTTLKATWDTASPARLDNHILAHEIIGFMDEEARYVFSRWAKDDEWEEIAEDLGTTPDAAERRFRYALQKARERVLGSKKAKSKSWPAVAKIS